MRLLTTLKLHVNLVTVCLGAGFASLQAQNNHLELSSSDWKSIESLDADILSSLPNDSPLLRMAYSQLFLRTPEKTTPPWYTATRADVRRRGTGATPILLSLFDENPEKAFQAQFLQRIGDITPENLTPYREAAHVLYGKQGQKLPARTCYAMAWFFAYHGTKEDLKILKGMLQHPDGEVSSVLTPLIRHMERRLGTPVQLR